MVLTFLFIPVTNCVTADYNQVIIIRSALQQLGNLNIGSVNNNNVPTVFVLLNFLFSDFRNKTKCPVNTKQPRVFISSKQQKAKCPNVPELTSYLLVHLSTSPSSLSSLWLGASGIWELFILHENPRTGEIDSFLIECGLGDWTDLVSISLTDTELSFLLTKQTNNR